jgi:hypothetical protein
MYCYGHHDHDAGLLTENLTAGLVAVASSNVWSWPTASTSAAGKLSFNEGFSNRPLMRVFRIAWRLKFRNRKAPYNFRIAPDTLYHFNFCLYDKDTSITVESQISTRQCLALDAGSNPREIFFFLQFFDSDG